MDFSKLDGLIPAVVQDENITPAGGTVGYLTKTATFTPVGASARLTFEVSDGERPIQLYRAGEPAVMGDEMHVVLAPRPASCKPRDRWLAEQTRQEVANCCGSTSQACCS